MEPRSPTPVAQPSSGRREGGLADERSVPSARPVPVAPFVSPVGASATGSAAGSAAGSATSPTAAPGAAAPRPAGGSPPARRPINPFLSTDPNQKARRLARALVSDMVAYHPQKREEGARAGTLKSLFREEIKKSYEEYVEQVGREFAESTTHFQEALNDILAGGKRIF